jgi:shikimate dehydrogenase
VINAAVLGSPINHSLSPLLHTIAYEHYGIKATYEAIEIRSGELSSFISGTQKNCLSLTMPLKEEALTVAGYVSDIAKKVSSGNTLTFRDGKWKLDSTDVAGFHFSLDSHGVQDLGSVIILGAGATARAAVAHLSTICRSIKVVSRNQARQTSMNFSSSCEIEYLPWVPTDLINQVDLVVNTTPGDAADLLVSGVTKPHGVFFEVLYNPWPTKLSQAWNSKGARVIDGLELLIHQAISQVEIFADISVDRPELHLLMRKAALAKLT